MPPDEIEPIGAEPSPPPGPAPTPDTPAAPPAGRPAAGSVWLIALAAAFLAGIASWPIAEVARGHFKPSKAASSQLYNFTALNREQPIANARNGALVFGALGGLLGLSLGLAGSLSQRPVRRAVRSAVVGLVLGAAAGALPSFAVLPWQYRNRHDDPSSTELLMPLLAHGGLWCGLGAAAGLAYGLGRGGFRPRPLVEGAVGGLIGAAIGTVFYELVGAIAFPLAKTTATFSETAPTRLLALLSVAVFTALGAAGSVTSGHGQTDSSPPRP